MKKKPSKINDFYDRLNVNRNADEEAIKNAYWDLARRWHPDKNPGDENMAKEEFIAVGEAYEVLSDEQQRKWYDSTGTFQNVRSWGHDSPRQGTPFSQAFEHYETIYREMDEDAELFMAAAYLGDTEILEVLLVEREKRTSSVVKRFFFPLVLTVQDLWDITKDQMFLVRHAFTPTYKIPPRKSSARYEKFFEELNVGEQ